MRLHLFKAIPFVLAASFVQAQTLPQAMQQALDVHPEIQAGVNSRIAADYQLRAAQGGYLPRVDLNAGYGRQGTDNATTRAQLWTILARQADADLTGGSIWYEKAQNWAKDKGISDGADPNAAITRAEVATIFFRLLTDETREANMTKSNSYNDLLSKLNGDVKIKENFYKPCRAWL